MRDFRTYCASQDDSCRHSRSWCRRSADRSGPATTEARGTGPNPVQTTVVFTPQWRFRPPDPARATKSMATGRAMVPPLAARPGRDWGASACTGCRGEQHADERAGKCHQPTSGLVQRRHQCDAVKRTVPVASTAASTARCRRGSPARHADRTGRGSSGGPRSTRRPRT